MKEAGPKVHSAPGKAAAFATTHWSVILEAGDGCSPQALDALEKLCRSYWYPVYAHIRRKGFNPPDAQDSTQAFFARLLEKNYLAQADRQRGRFRSFLLGCLDHFLSDERDRARAEKRGGKHIFISWDEQCAEKRYHLEPADEMRPELLFDRGWALSILEGAQGRLREEYASKGKGDLFDKVKVFEAGAESKSTYAEVARQLSTTESAIRSEVLRMRRRFRELVRDEVAKTVLHVLDVDEEIRYLLAVMRH